MQPTRSHLHLQLGQEVIYVLMALGMLTALILVANAERLRIPLPDCALPGHGGCVERAMTAVEPPLLPQCAQPGQGPCYGPKDVPRCMLSPKGCMETVDVPPCARSPNGCMETVNLPPCMQSAKRCMETVDLPPCLQTPKGCMDALDLPPCLQSPKGCMEAVDLPDCMKAGHGPCSEQPPILNLTEREGFRFATASYEISPAFMEKLRTDIAPAIVRRGDQLHAHVVEVVGHTDSVPLADRRYGTSSLDYSLNRYLSGDKTLSGSRAIVMSDNVDLGMMRAAAVARALQDLPDLRDHGFIFLAMSAGQTVGPDDQPIGAESAQPAGDEARRRVEIRLRRSLADRRAGTGTLP